MRLAIGFRVAPFCLLFLCPWCLCAEPSLEARLAPLAKDHKGKAAIAVKHLKNGKGFYFHADEPMPTASLIKLAVMIETYQQASEGKVNLSHRVTLHEPHKVPGSGILTEHFSACATYTLRDDVRILILLSANTA